jgi:hypothetical protein
MLGKWAGAVLIGCLVLAGPANAEEFSETDGWQRVDSRYCTIWLEPSLNVSKVERKIGTWRVRPRFETESGDDSPEGKLAAKCDTLFRKAEEILDMYPPGIHVTIRIAREREEVDLAHASRYGYRTEAVAIYVFENNTIYASIEELSESVLVHEMGHCIIDHFFQMRPPRKVEEMLAMYVDEHLRD